MKNFIKMALALVAVIITASVKAPPMSGATQTTTVIPSGIHHGGVWHTLQELDVQAHQTPKIQILEHIPEPSPAQLAEPETKPAKKLMGRTFKRLHCTLGKIRIEENEWMNLEKNDLATLSIKLEEKCKNLGSPEKVTAETSGVAPRESFEEVVVWPKIDFSGLPL